MCLKPPSATSVMLYGSPLPCFRRTPPLIKYPQEDKRKGQQAAGPMTVPGLQVFCLILLFDAPRPWCLRVGGLFSLFLDRSAMTHLAFFTTSPNPYLTQSSILDEPNARIYSRIPQTSFLLSASSQSLVLEHEQTVHESCTRHDDIRGFRA